MPSKRTARRTRQRQGPPGRRNLSRGLYTNTFLSSITGATGQTRVSYTLSELTGFNSSFPRDVILKSVKILMSPRTPALAHSCRVQLFASGPVWTGATPALANYVAMVPYQMVSLTTPKSMTLNMNLPTMKVPLQSTDPDYVVGLQQIGLSATTFLDLTITARFVVLPQQVLATVVGLFDESGYPVRTALNKGPFVFSDPTNSEQFVIPAFKEHPLYADFIKRREASESIEFQTFVDALPNKLTLLNLNTV